VAKKARSALPGEDKVQKAMAAVRAAVSYHRNLMDQKEEHKFLLELQMDADAMMEAFDEEHKGESDE
jgi:3'-phosphoadenosine 5'-phosphosulfate sulfotransferase